MKKRTLALIALLAIGLAGCTAAPTPEPTRSSETTEAPTASSIVVSAEDITLLTDDGSELATYNYFEPLPATAIEQLTFVFGYRPEVTEQEAAGSSPRTTIHDWSGFEFAEFHDVTPSYPEINSFDIGLRVPEVGGVALSAEGGIAVGSEAAVAAPIAFRYVPSSGGSDPVDLYYLDETPVETTAVPDYEPAALSVEVWVAGKDARVVLIQAPSRNWGA